MKIGAITESFRREALFDAVNDAAKLGVNGLQAYAGHAFAFDASEAELLKIKEYVNDHGLEFSAICGDFGNAMYYEKDRALIDREKRILEMARILGTNIVTTHIGVVAYNQYFHVNLYLFSVRITIFMLFTFMVQRYYKNIYE